MASKVPGGAATPRGRMLHLILPEVFLASRSHHSFCAMLNACVGGTQLETVSTVCAAAGAQATVSVTARANSRRFIEQLLRESVNVRPSNRRNGPDFPGFADERPC